MNIQQLQQERDHYKSLLEESTQLLKSNMRHLGLTDEEEVRKFLKKSEGAYYNPQDFDMRERAASNID